MSERGATQALKAVTSGEAPTKATSNPAVDALNKAMAGIKSVLPSHITPERMAKLSLGMLRTNAKLLKAAKANPSSFVNAIMQASRIGLEPGIDAHLVPYENKKQGTTEVQMIPDWRGLLSLARRSGQITSVSVQIVYENDSFELELGLSEKLVHKPNLRGDRGKPTLVYGVAKFVDGAHHVEWMSVDDINAIRDSSSGYRTAKRYSNDNTPWIANWEEMARKTLVRRMSKYLPRSIEIVNAEKIMDAGDQGTKAVFDGDFVVVEDAEETDTGDDGGSGGGGGTPEQRGIEHNPSDRPPTDLMRDQQTADEARMGERSPAQQQQQAGPGLEDAIAAVKSGDYDGAREIGRSLTETDRSTIEATIKSRDANAQPARQRRNPPQNVD